MGSDTFEERLLALLPFAVALAIGALIGIERQRAQGEDPKSPLGGIRTFPLIALLGCSAAWLGKVVGLEAFLAIVVAFVVLFGIGYAFSCWNGDPGMTTEVAAALTFVFGAMAFHEHFLLAAALAVATTVLLSMRQPLHRFAGKIEQEDLFAALKLAVVTVIILPLLPDEDYGPERFAIYNPFKIWLLVVFIAAIGFTGYVLVKLFGSGHGIPLAGALGGLVSSTAATLGFSGKSKDNPELSPMFALGIALAWEVMFVRTLIEVAVVNMELLPLLAWPVGGAMAAGLIGGGLLYLRARRSEPPPDMAYSNPFSLTSALKFGALFVLVLTVAQAAQLWFDNAGVLVAAALSGTVDVDAMTLTLAKLSGSQLQPVTAVQGICITLASNTVVKAGMAAALGTHALRNALLPVALAMLAAGGVMLMLFV